jgi:outer membrane receptor for ferrienterochelin and colicins
MRLIFSSIVFCLLGAMASAQTTVTFLDDTGKPLPFGHIIFKGIQGEGETTLLADMDGKATIPSSFTDQHPRFILRATYLGFKAKVDTVSANVPITIRLMPDLFAVEQVVITAQYTPTSTDKAVHSTKVIDRKRIEAQAAITLRDVLQKETNMRISQDNILGSGLSMQGISGQNVKILIDGVPMIGRLDGNIDLSQINMNTIERIEIVEGPLSVNYGTDALAGTINLITRKDQKDDLQLEWNGYYESVGQYNTDARIGICRGSHQFSVSGGRNYFGGWSAGQPFFAFPEETMADSSRFRSWKPKEQGFGQVQYRFIRNQWSLRAYGDVYFEDITNRGLPRAPFQTSAFDDTYRTSRYNSGLDADAKLGQQHHVKILASYNDFERVKNSWFRDLTTLEALPVPSVTEHDTSRFTLWMSRGTFARAKAGAKLNYEAGYDINVETAYGRRITDGQQTIGDYAFFGSMEYSPMAKLTIRPGVRWGYNSAYAAPATPSLHVRWEVGKFTVRASYARGFRAPSLKELHFDFVDINHNITGNTELMAEHSDNVTVNLRWKFLRDQTALRLELGGYYNDIRNLITLGLRPGTQEYTYINVGLFRTVGAQFNTHLRFHHLTADIGGAYVGRYNVLSESLSAPMFSFSPEFRSAITYDVKPWKLSISLFYNYIGVLPTYLTDGEGGVRIGQQDDYHLMDLTLAKTLWKGRITWSAGAKNLLDVQQVNSSVGGGGVHSAGAGSVPVAWGRTVFMGLKLNIGIKLKR